MESNAFMFLMSTLVILLFVNLYNGKIIPDIRKQYTNVDTREGVDLLLSNTFNSIPAYENTDINKYSKITYEHTSIPLFLKT